MTTGPMISEGGSPECLHEFGALGAASSSYCIHCGAKLIPNPEWEADDDPNADISEKFSADIIRSATAFDSRETH